MAGGMGPVPLTHSELQSWQDQVGIELQPWELQLLRRLSKEYVAESGNATDRGCPAPWQPEEFKPDRMLAAIEQRDAFRNLARL